MNSVAIKRPRLLESSLRPDLTNDEIISSTKTAWLSHSKDFSKNGVEIIANPFPVCIVRNFVNNPELLKSVVGELKDVTFHQKSNDLYEFKQSEDVRNLKNFSFIPQLYHVIETEWRNWVSFIIGWDNLREDISATFSLYEYKDRLLCHDDKCEDRHVAFVLYLVEDWNENDGGALQLFNTDSNGYPSEIVKSINPQFNMMIFFEVTHDSFHQVSEVVSKTKKRLSINGWFHSSRILDSANNVILESQQSLATDKEYTLQQYFLFTYFDIMNQMDIKNIFSTESEIQLDEFIVPTFLEQIRSDLTKNSVTWITKGPANMRNYYVADELTLPASLQILKEIFESKCWFRYLKDITGLDFSPSVNSDLKIWEKGYLPSCHFEIQQWTHLCYTLIHDQDPEFHTEALDMMLRIPFERTEESEDDDGDAPEAGHMIYIDSSSKSEECLLHIGYKMNSLGLVFRDKKTLRFTKYLDSTAKPFYQILCTYRPWKPPFNQPNLKHCEEDDDDTEVSVSEDESSNCS